jgi:quinoprotein glucose dehydrogenase
VNKTRTGALATILAVASTLLPPVWAETESPTSSSSAIGWPAFGSTPGGLHYSPARQITRDNVARLEQAWVHNSGDFREGGRLPSGAYAPQSSFQVTPILIADTLYYCTPFNRVFALDAETGLEKWVFDPELEADAYQLPNCRGVSSWQSDDSPESACSHRIFTGTLDSRLIAIDGATGKRCEDFGDNGEVDLTAGLSEHANVEYGVTSPPAILGDLVITGAMVLDGVRVDVPSGVVRAYDTRTGELRWAWNPVPDDARKLEADGSYRSGTTNVWSIISVDEARNLVFVPTGNTSPDFYGGHREGLDEYSSSLIALDGDNGRVVWTYQFVHHDIWDFDTPSQPTLVDLQINGKTVPAVIQMTKMGMTWALHRETGEPLYPVEERAVPQDPVAGEYLSPTQPFPSHFPHLLGRISADDAWGLTFWDKGSCRKAMAALRNDGIYTPPSTEGTLYYPGNAGGNNWGSPAIQPDQQMLFTVTIRIPNFLQLIPRAECEAQGRYGSQQGSPYCHTTDFLMSPLGIPCTEPPWSTLDAIDMVSGELRWSVPLGTSRDIAPFPAWWIKGVPAIGGPAVTDSDLVFVGAAMEHAFRAFDATTGKELWKVRLPTAANSIPMTYQLADGRQFVVIAAGGHWGGINPPGDHLIAFALPAADE